MPAWYSGTLNNKMMIVKLLKSLFAVLLYLADKRNRPLRDQDVRMDTRYKNVIICLDDVTFYKMFVGLQKESIGDGKCPAGFSVRKYTIGFLFSKVFAKPQFSVPF